MTTGTYDLDGIKTHGGEVLNDGIRVHGWKIQTAKAPILPDAEVEACAAALGTTGPVKLPEVLFGHNVLSLTHEASGVCISFRAFEALQHWKSEAIPALQVSMAAQWQAAREAEIQRQHATVLSYDWTYTTPYMGSTHTMASDGKAAAEELPWQASTQHIDRALLMEREPILFYDEVPLYESDLDDFGVVRLTAKLRVMPKCWLVLLRFWLRVDGHLVRLREARLFCRHDSPEAAAQIIREVKHYEATYAELRTASSANEGSALLDPDAASQLFQAMAPFGMKTMRLEQLAVAPHS